ncbi:MAG: GtrA family protein [Eubacteriales bacterium]|nr:GtrA family protein [Eubacteriales bacterium]
MLYHNDVIRYIFFGGCTTLVNLISFYILRRLNVNLNIANLISIVLAILFAYVVNSRFVFQDHCETLKDHLAPFCKFISARGATMIIELLGVWLFVECLHWGDMIGKFITQFVVLVLNYVFSKFFVFTTGKK